MDIATDDLALQLVSLVFIAGGFAGCGLLWYLMVVKGGREERRDAEEAARRNGVDGPEDQRP